MALKRLFLWVGGVVVGLPLLLLLAWLVVAGPGTVYRVLRYGDTDIDDFRHYPGRSLEPSRTPVHLPRDERAITLSAGSTAGLAADDLDAADLAAGDLDALLQRHDTIAFLVLRDGVVTYERYFQGHGPEELSQLFSVSKSVTSLLIGMAIDDGILSGVEQPLTELVPELADRGFGGVTLHHLLTMTSGSSYHENDNPFGKHVSLNFTPALEREILSFGMERAPGELFRYKSGDNALLALALDRALGDEALGDEALGGETITAYAQRRLWDPLGMEDRGVWTIDHAGDGLEKTWCCLATSARDLAKIGLLFLGNGSTRGQQLVSADWVLRSSRQDQLPAGAWPADYAQVGWRGYGYQWWLASPEDEDFFASGKDGQFLYVNPAEQVVIVRLGRSSGRWFASRWLRLFQAIARTS